MNVRISSEPVMRPDPIQGNPRSLKRLKVRILWLVGLGIMTFGLRSLVKSQANQQAAGWVNLPCDTPVLNYRSVATGSFVLRSKGRCWSGVLMPPDAALYHSEPLGDHDWYYYIMFPDGQVKGPINWRYIPLTLPERFSIQSTRDGDIKFWKPSI